MIDMKLNKNLLAGGVLASVLVLGACGANTTASADDMEWETEESNGSVTVRDNAETELGTTAQEAVDKALKEFEGTVTDVEYDEDEGVYYYDIEIENGHEDFEVKLNAEDLSIIEQDLDRDDEDKEQTAEKNSNQSDGSNSRVKLSDAFKDDKSFEAIEAAQKRFDGILEEVSYDEDDGVYYYEVKLENKNEEYEVKLKADDLSVLEEEHDNDNNERGFKRLEAAQTEKIISLKQAREAALEAADGEIEQWEYDADDFKYEFEIDDYEVKINAKTGDVTEIDD
ncbi:hypothetical protein E4T89_06290 [Jeotgalicoccus nanhaiensis]|nr:hypothetical protein E4T89_06290 [Jeotgalicoccus nanhaiensis]